MATSLVSATPCIAITLLPQWVSPWHEAGPLPAEEQALPPDYWELHCAKPQPIINQLLMDW